MTKHAVATAVQAALNAERSVRANPPAARAEPSCPGPASVPEAGPSPGRSECWVGIDVAKAHLDVATWPTSERLWVGRDDAGLAELTGWLHGRAPSRIVLAATGGLETPVVTAPWSGSVRSIAIPANAGAAA